MICVCLDTVIILLLSALSYYLMAAPVVVNALPQLIIDLVESAAALDGLRARGSALLPALLCVFPTVGEVVRA